MEDIDPSTTEKYLLGAGFRFPYKRFRMGGRAGGAIFVPASSIFMGFPSS